VTLISKRHVVSMALKLEDGTELILEFDETNRPRYQIETNYSADYRASESGKVFSGRQFMEHMIFWIENIEGSEITRESKT